MKKRSVTIRRKTKETNITLELNLDGRGKYSISTGIGFLNHMLELFSYQGGFDLKLKVQGDLDVDIHHTNEDIGIVLGQALDKALGNKRGIRRFGFFYVPMEEALVRVVLDISGRSSLYIRKDVKVGRGENYKFSDLKHFLESFVRTAGINLHIDILRGEDFHHILEAVFKSLSKALQMALEIIPGDKRIPSTKGRL